MVLLESKLYSECHNQFAFKQCIQMNLRNVEKLAGRLWGLGNKSYRFFKILIQSTERNFFPGNFIHKTFYYLLVTNLQFCQVLNHSSLERGWCVWKDSRSVLPHSAARPYWWHKSAEQLSWKWNFLAFTLSGFKRQLFSCMGLPVLGWLTYR